MSIAGGIHNAVQSALDIGADCMQIFCKNQRQWKAKPLAPEDVRAYRDALAASGLGPVMVHDSYLINLGHPDPVKAAAAKGAFIDEYRRSEALGVDFLNFHPGSHTHEDKAARDDRRVRDACVDRIAAAVCAVLDETKGGRCRIVVENAAGQGSNVGSTWEECGRLLDAVGNDARTGLTVDTQHAWASGYDWLRGYDGVWDAFDSCVGLDRLVAFHLNDSKQPCGSRLDRHDTVGQGLLGTPFFRALMQDPRFKRLAGFLETPEGPESWRHELAFLRALERGEDAQPPGPPAAQRRLEVGAPGPAPVAKPAPAARKRAGPRRA